MPQKEGQRRYSLLLSTLRYIEHSTSNVKDRENKKAIQTMKRSFVADDDEEVEYRGDSEVESEAESDSGDDEDFDDNDGAPKKKSSKRAKRQVKAKPKAKEAKTAKSTRAVRGKESSQMEVKDETADSADPQIKDEASSPKASKPALSSSATSSTSNGPFKTPEDETFYRIGGDRRVTVRKYKGKTLIDIREFYTDKNTEEEKPGRKGISLDLNAWNLLKEAMEGVDGIVATL